MCARIIGNRSPSTTAMRSIDSGQLLGQHDVPRDGDGGGAGRVVVPVDAEQVARVGVVRADLGQGVGDPGRDPGRVGELGEGGQDDAGGPEVRDGAVTGAWIDQVVLHSE